ncbi:hypothetical protein L6R46_29855 [Myxococcota bacterium]|nr:hypothetical protein [Myxococcota bacterium]
MSSRQILVFMLALTGCSGASPESKDVAVEEDGSCFGMRMTATLTADAASCSFSLADWSMSHGNLPEGGAVTGAAVTLSGGDFEGCTGSVDAAAMSGICDDGCAWELAYVQ